jgi:hypothetical protein
MKTKRRIKMFTVSIKAENVSDFKSQLVTLLGELVVEEPPARAPSPAREALKIAMEQPKHYIPPTPAMPTFVPAPLPAPVVQDIVAHQGPTRTETEIAAQVRVASPGGDQYDQRGVPWDARVHSSSKDITGKGVWRTRRGVDAATLHQIEATLQRQQTTAAPVQTSFAIPPVPQVPTPVYNPAPAAPIQQVASVPAISQVNTQPVAQPVQNFDPIQVPSTLKKKQAHNLDSFKATIIPSLAKLVEDRWIDQAYVQSLKEYFQVQELWQVAGDPVKVNEMFENFCAAGIINKVGT